MDDEPRGYVYCGWCMNPGDIQIVDDGPRGYVDCG